MFNSCATPWTVCSPPGFSVHGISQARILEWVAISFSRGSSNSGTEPTSPVLQADCFPLSYWEALIGLIRLYHMNLPILSIFYQEREKERERPFLILSPNICPFKQHQYWPRRHHVLLFLFHLPGHFFPGHLCPPLLFFPLTGSKAQAQSCFSSLFSLHPLSLEDLIWAHIFLFQLHVTNSQMSNPLVQPPPLSYTLVHLCL